MFVQMYLPPVSDDFMMSPLMRAAAVDWMTGVGPRSFQTEITPRAQVFGKRSSYLYR